MLIREKMVANVGSSATLSLVIPAGESAIVKDVHLWGPAPLAENVLLSVEQKSIMQFVAPIHFGLLRDDLPNGILSVWDSLRKMGWFEGVPVAAGETLTFGPTSASDVAEIVYNLHTEGDYKKTDVNGSESGRFQMLQMISNSIAGTAGATVTLDQSDLSNVFPSFPGGDTVPAGTRMVLHGLFSAPAVKDDGVGDDWYADRLYLIRNQEDILAKNLNGTLFQAERALALITGVQFSAIASRLNLGVDGQDADLIMFDDPLVFESGEELTVRVSTVAGPQAGAIVIGDVKLGLIFDVIR